MPKVHSAPKSPAVRVSIPKDIATIAETVLLGYHRIAPKRKRKGEIKVMSADARVTFGNRADGAMAYLKNAALSAGFSKVPTMDEVYKALEGLGYNVRWNGDKHESFSAAPNKGGTGGKVVDYSAGLSELFS